jgi:hypothetical protein
VAYWIASLLMVLVGGYLVYLGWKVPVPAQDRGEAAAPGLERERAEQPYFPLGDPARGRVIPTGILTRFTASVTERAGRTRSVAFVTEGVAGQVEGPKSTLDGRSEAGQ